MELLTLVILIEHILLLFVAIATLYFSLNILARKIYYKKIKSTSLMLIIYLYYQMIWAFLELIYCIYIIAFWHPELILYNQKTLFIIGVPSYFVMMLNTVVEGFLGIDRCFCIIFPIKYKKSISKPFAIISVITFISYTLFLFYMNNLFQQNPTDLNVKSCRFFSCLFFQEEVRLYVYIIKLLSIFITAAAGGTLFFLVKYYLHNTQCKKLHQTVIGVICATIIFEFFPNLMGFLFILKYKIQLAAFLGPYSICLISINITVCSWIYYRTLKTHFNRVTNT